MIGHAWTVVAESSSLDRINAFLSIPTQFRIRKLSNQREVALLAFDIVSLWFKVDSTEKERIRYRVLYDNKNIFETTIDVNMDAPFHRTRFHVDNMPITGTGVAFVHVLENSSDDAIAVIPFAVSVEYYGFDTTEDDTLQVVPVSNEILQRSPPRPVPVVKGEPFELKESDISEDEQAE